MLPCLSAIIVNSDSYVASPNPVFALWIHQDQLVLNVIIGSVSANLVIFIALSTSSCVAWITLEKTYVSPSHGRIMGFGGCLPNLSQGNKTITAYMQDIKNCIDLLALMNKPMDFYDLSILILNGLDPAYSKLSHAL